MEQLIWYPPVNVRMDEENSPWNFPYFSEQETVGNPGFSTSLLVYRRVSIHGDFFARKMNYSTRNAMKKYPGFSFSLMVSSKKSGWVKLSQTLNIPEQSWTCFSLLVATHIPTSDFWHSRIVIVMRRPYERWLAVTQFCWHRLFRELSQITLPDDNRAWAGCTGWHYTVYVPWSKLGLAEL